MKNNLLDLRTNIDTVLTVREELCDNYSAKPYPDRDVDTESLGYWLKMPSADGESWSAVGIYIKPGVGISVNINTRAFYKLINGVPSSDEVLNVLSDGFSELNIKTKL